MQTLPETQFQMLLYWLIEEHVYKRLVLPWQQLTTRRNSANENARNILLVRQLTELT